MATVSYQVLILFLLTLCGSVSVESVETYVPQFSNPLGDPERWRKYPGLSGKRLQSLTSDTQGNLWFGTKDGVYKYDGLHWLEYPMPEHLRGPFGVQHLSFDRDGQLFAATESALSRLVEDRWERIFPETKTVALPTHGISPGLHSGIWTATAFGILRYEKEVITAYTDASNASWLENVSQGIRVFVIPDSMVVSQHLSEPHLGFLAHAGFIYAILPGSPAEREGLQPGDWIQESSSTDRYKDEKTFRVLWKETKKYGKVTLAPEHIQTPLSDLNTSCVFQDNSQRVWFGQIRGTVGSFRVADDGEPYDFKKFGPDEGLGSFGPARFLESSDGKIWVVTSVAGSPSYVYEKGKWQEVDFSAITGVHNGNLNPSDLPPWNVTSPKVRIWT